MKARHVPLIPNRDSRADRATGQDRGCQRFLVSESLTLLRLFRRRQGASLEAQDKLVMGCLKNIADC